MIAIETSRMKNKERRLPLKNNGISTKTTMILIARVEEMGKSGKMAKVE